MKVYNPLDVDYHFVLLLEAININGDGVPGKVPTSVVVSSQSNSGDLIVISIAEWSSDFKESSKDGIIVVPIKVNCIGAPMKRPLSVELTATVDGETVTSTPIELITMRLSPIDATYLVVPTFGGPTPILSLHTTVANTYVWTLLNAKCEAITAIPNLAPVVTLESYFDPEGYAPLPENFFEFKNPSYTLTNAAPSLAKMDVAGFRIAKAPKDYIYLRAVISNNVKNQPVYSEPLLVSLNFFISRSEIVSINGVALNGLSYPANLTVGSTYTMVIKLMNELGKGMNSTTPPLPEFTILRLPPMYYETYSLNKWDILGLTAGNATDTSGSGLVTQSI